MAQDVSSTLYVLNTPIEGRLLEAIGEIQHNLDYLLVWRTEEAYGPQNGKTRQVVLPLMQWWLEPKMCFWFDIKLGGRVVERVYEQVRDVPQDVHAKLDHIKWRCRNKELTNELASMLVLEMHSMMQGGEMKHHVVSMFEQTRKCWMKLELDWRKLGKPSPWWMDSPANGNIPQVA